MTPPAKSAALRSASSGELDTPEAVEQARSRILPPRPVNRAPARAEARPDDRLVNFPSFEASRAPRKAAPAPAATEAAPDLGAELEAALMNDLESMVALFDQAARDGNAPDPRAAPSADPDQEALERLLTSIRQGDGAPRGAPLPASMAPVVVAPEAEPAAEIAAEPATPPHRPASPRPEGRENRLAPPSPRQRRPRPDAANDSGADAKVAPRAPNRPAAQRPPRAEPLAALTEPSERRSYLKPAIAVSALILVAAIGAGMTIRALTATSDPAPTETATAAPAMAAPAETSSAETSPTETSVAATPAAPQTSAPPVAASPEPAATETGSSPVRMAADNSLDAPSAPPAASMTAAEPADASPAPVRMAEPSAPAETASSSTPVPMTAPAPEPVAEPEVASAEPLPAVSEPAAATPELSASEAPPVAEAPAAPKVIASIPAGSSSGGLQPGAATIASGVNLRSNPDNGAPVIGVLKTGTSVEIVGCKIWCEIVAGDKRGFVFQKFLSQS
jgi:hypothetical protein